MRYILAQKKKRKEAAKGNPAWTPELTDKLRIAWFEDPGSADEIAVKLGFNGKNAIIGKAHSTIGLARPAPEERLRRQRERAAGNPIPLPNSVPPPPPAPAPEPEQPLPTASELPRATPRGTAFEQEVELREAQRLRSEWILAPQQPSANEPPSATCKCRLLNIETRQEKDCGKATLPGSPYCGEHTIEMRARMQYQRDFDPLG